MLIDDLHLNSQDLVDYLHDLDIARALHGPFEVGDTKLSDFLLNLVTYIARLEHAHNSLLDLATATLNQDIMLKKQIDSIRELLEDQDLASAEIVARLKLILHSHPERPFCVNT